MSAAALYQLGPIQFTVAPLNVHAVVRESNTDFAEKPIIGSSEPPPLEYVGEGAEVMTFQGRLFPKQFGGLKGLEALQKMRESGASFKLMRGDGTPFGWYKIVNITERSSFLDRDGVGRMVDFDLNLRLVKKTNAGRGDGGDAVSLGVIFDLKEFIKWLT